MEPTLTNLVVSAEAMARIDDRLCYLIREATATCAILLDHSGQIIRVAGDFDGQDLVSLGALLAGNFASAREIARLLREPQFRVCFQQGEHQHVMTSVVGGRCLLSVLFRASSQLGLVKVLSGRAADELAGIVVEGSRQAHADGLDPRSFRAAAESGIDRWFREQRD